MSSDQKFTKSHFTALRNKLVTGLNKKLHTLTANESCIIENKQQIVDSEKSRIPCRSELLRLQQIECIENFVELFSDLIITFTEDPYVR